MAVAVLTIASGTVSSTLTDYPLMVRMSDLPTDVKSALNGTAGNLRAYKMDLTALPLDIISWNGTDGYLFVKVPSVASGSATQVRFDTTAIGDAQPAVTDPLGRNTVWTDYEFVTFGETSSYLDHAGKQTATTEGSQIRSVTGISSDLFCGCAVEVFNPASVSSNSGLKYPLSADLRSFTFSASLMQRRESNADNYGVASLYSNANNGNRKTMAWRGSEGLNADDSMECWDTTNSWFAPTIKFVPTVDVTRFRGTLTYNGNSGTRRQLWNGPSGTTASAAYGSHPIGDRFIFGVNQPSGGEPGQVQGGFMYVRASVLADAWLSAEYSNLSAPASFYSIADMFPATTHGLGVSMAALVSSDNFASPAASLGLTQAATLTTMVAASKQPVVCVMT